VSKEEKIMSWDCGFFISKNNLFQKQEANEEIKNENKTVHCSVCNQPIGIISTTLYEIDGKQFCVDCYSNIIIKEDLERDHFDVKQQKIAIQKTSI
jgi:hypothetical protein